MMEAKEYLEQVEKINMMITNKLSEVDQWKSIAHGITSPMDGKERIKSTGNLQKMSDAVAMYVDIQAEIDAEIDRLVDIKKDVIHNIEQLPAVEYDVLHKVYIQFKDFKEISVEYDKTYSWVTTVHGRALKHLQNILNK